MRFIFLLVVSWLVPATFATADDRLPWDLAELHKPPKMQWVDETSPVRSLIYSGPPYQGEPTEIFAFYATPGSVRGDASLDHDLPAVVLVHGGGGTAFAEWVWLWAER